MAVTERLRSCWRSGTPAFGGWCSIPNSFSAEIVASLGFDYVCIDMQHGLADFHDLIPMLQALSAYESTPVVRLPIGAFATAQRVLDAGAEALIFPMVNSSQDAANAVEACRYSPLGRRSFGPVRSRFRLGPDPDGANKAVSCIVMIETPDAIHQLDAILRTPGVDAIYVGPADLAISLGVPVGSAQPRLESAISGILEAARSAHIPAGIHTDGGETAASRIAQGFSFATVHTDAAILAAAYTQQLDLARTFQAPISDANESEH